MINDTNTSLMSSISTNNFLRDCIDLAIDGFLFRGITPSDHYYRFSQSFPKAFTLLSSNPNPNGSSMIMTPKQSHHHHTSSSSSTSKHSNTHHQRTNNVPPLDLSSLNPNILLEQQPVSTIMSTNNTGITIKTKKPVYSPKDVRAFFYQTVSIMTVVFFSSITFLLYARTLNDRLNMKGYDERKLIAYTIINMKYIEGHQITSMTKTNKSIVHEKQRKRP